MDNIRKLLRKLQTFKRLERLRRVEDLRQQEVIIIQIIENPSFLLAMESQRVIVSNAMERVRRQLRELGLKSAFDVAPAA